MCFNFFASGWKRTEKFLGLPLPVWGVFCLAFSLLWVFIWPSDRAVPAEAIRYFILRWFHALVWVLLGLAAFIAAFQKLGGARLARPVALASLIVYLVFMAVFLTSQKPQ
jgi:hypothetical protein